MCVLKRYGLFYLLALLINLSFFTNVKGQMHSFEFYGHTFNISLDSNIILKEKVEFNTKHISDIYHTLEASNYQPVVDTLLAFQKKKQLNDWLFYQLIRKTAETICAKKKNY